MPDFRLSPEAAAAMARANAHDGLVGALFGSALGDAIGLYTEFLSEALSRRSYPSASFTLHPNPTPLRPDSHRDPHVPGEWTDDTDHAMLLLLSYLHRDGAVLDAKDLAARLDVWVRMGLLALDTPPLGLGHTVGSIVRTKTYLDDPEGTARALWARRGYQIAPNGSLMRTHPLGLMCLDKTVEETFQVAADFSVITHVDPRCIMSCAIGTALVRGLVLNEVCTEEAIDDVVDRAIQWWVGYRRAQMADESRHGEPDLDLDELRRHVKVDNLSDLQLDDAMKIGYVYKCLGSGLHLLRVAMRRLASTNHALATQTSLFEPLITELTMLGGDADTNACFAGALLGALLGYKALPTHWREGLVHGDWLMGKAEALSKVVGVSGGAYSGAEDPDTALDGGRGFLTEAQMEGKFMLLQANMAQRETKRRQEEEEREKKSKKASRSSWYKRS
ncbi:putative ADP-ribosylglycohydrolase [Stachybotrys elegans]|uniref:ADP-ribosylglycohydrolase n=1 Tax=Stachybotrys elegans TaxID=80388 RepID=A0A8K0SN83_9HYPO|nr:putative ADP-ribosylglycohydrolase [Stachybotrys elegans]